MQKRIKNVNGIIVVDRPLTKNHILLIHPRYNANFCDVSFRKKIQYTSFSSLNENKGKPYINYIPRFSRNAPKGV